MIIFRDKQIKLTNEELLQAYNEENFNRRKHDIEYVLRNNFEDIKIKKKH